MSGILTIPDIISSSGNEKIPTPVVPGANSKSRQAEKETRLKYAHNQIIQDYLDYLLTIKGYSDHTLDSYKHDLVWLFRYVRLNRNDIDKEKLVRKRKNGKDFVDYTMIDIRDVGEDEISKISFQDLLAFLAFTARELNNSENSRKRKVTTLKGFFRYLQAVRRIMDKNPAQELEAPKVGRPQPYYLTLEEAQDLLDTPTGKHTLRDKAILTIFLNTGLRVSELVALRLSDIQGDMIHIRGKGQKDRTLFLNDACLQALSAYLPLRAQQAKVQHLSTDVVFLSQKGTQFSSRGIEHMIEKYITQIGLDPRRYTVHTLRHTAATLMHKYGDIDIKTLQQVLGHESTQTTEIYTHLDSDEIADALHSNPLSQYKTSEDADVSKVFGLNKNDTPDSGISEAFDQAIKMQPGQTGEN